MCYISVWATVSVRGACAGKEGAKILESWVLRLMIALRSQTSLLLGSYSSPLKSEPGILLCASPST